MCSDGFSSDLAFVVRDCPRESSEFDTCDCLLGWSSAPQLCLLPQRFSHCCGRPNVIAPPSVEGPMGSMQR